MRIDTEYVEKVVKNQKNPKAVAKGMSTLMHGLHPAAFEARFAKRHFPDHQALEPGALIRMAVGACVVCDAQRLQRCCEITGAKVFSVLKALAEGGE